MYDIDKKVRTGNVVVIVKGKIYNAYGADKALGVFHGEQERLIFKTLLMTGEYQTDEIVLPAGIRVRGIDRCNVI